MALSDLFDNIEAGVLVIQTGVNFARGGENVHAEASPPRVVWEPLREAFSGAEMHGPAAGGQNNTASPRTRAIRSRACAVRAHIWGGDFTATETLLNNVIAALHQQTGGSYELQGATWGPEAEGEFGRVYLLDFTVLVPVVLPGTTVVVPTKQQQTFQIGNSSQQLPTNP